MWYSNSIMGWTTEGSWFNSWQRRKIVLFSTMSKLALRHTQPHIQRIMGILPTGVKQLGHEADTHPIQWHCKKISGALPPLLQTP